VDANQGAVEEDVLATIMHFLALLSVNAILLTVKIWLGIKIMMKMIWSNSSC